MILKNIIIVFPVVQTLAFWERLLRLFFSRQGKCTIPWRNYGESWHSQNKQKTDRQMENKCLSVGNVMLHSRWVCVTLKKFFPCVYWDLNTTYWDLYTILFWESRHIFTPNIIKILPFLKFKVYRCKCSWLYEWYTKRIW